MIVKLLKLPYLATFFIVIECTQHLFTSYLARELI